MHDTHRLLLATNNQGKIIEIQSALKPLHLDLLIPTDLGLEIHVVEDGHSYAENARKKALAFTKVSKLISLADDSGLEVDALNGEPGLYSARYSPKIDASDKDRRELLLSQLADIPRPWTASFQASIAIADPNGQVYVVEGSCTGEILPEERGDSGFGYDPIFLVNEAGRTMAELDVVDKNRLSHRGRALQKVTPILTSLFHFENH